MKAAEDFLKEISLKSLPEYRKAVKDLREEAAPALRQALNALIEIARRTSARGESARLERLRDVRWEERFPDKTRQLLTADLRRICG